MSTEQDVDVTNTIFLGFSPIFGVKKLAFFSKKNVAIKFSKKTSSSLSNNRPFFAIFWQKYFLNHASINKLSNFFPTQNYFFNINVRSVCSKSAPFVVQIDNIIAILKNGNCTNCIISF
jgi:hypothetical protein